MLIFLQICKPDFSIGALSCAHMPAYTLKNLKENIESVSKYVFKIWWIFLPLLAYVKKCVMLLIKLYESMKLLNPKFHKNRKFAKCCRYLFNTNISSFFVQKTCIATERPLAIMKKRLTVESRPARPWVSL